jgi:hypothetical protein
MTKPTHQAATITYPTIVYQKKTDVPPGYVAVPVASEAQMKMLSGPVFLTAEEAALGLHPSQLHPQIVTYPTTVYQKTDVPPGYVAVPVASEAEVIALTGAVFLTPEGALRYQPPVEQPIAHIARTDNLEQYRPGKTVLGVETPVPVARENPLPGTYVRGTPAPEPPPTEPPPGT